MCLRQRVRSAATVLSVAGIVGGVALGACVPSTVTVIPVAEPGRQIGPVVPIVPEAVPIPNSSQVRGRSTTTVYAPVDEVRAIVVAVARYAEFMPHYKASRVVGQSASGGREVYIDIEAMNGAFKFQVRLDVPSTPVIAPDGAEVYQTKFLGGNVNSFFAEWRIKKLDEHSTTVTLEVHLDPPVFAPVGMINYENLKASGEGLAAMKLRAELGTK